LAVTAAFPFSVKVQVLVLFPPLEHAPDQITSRPFVALNVIDVPTLNEAEPVLPTETLIPAGLDVTRSPPRPVAVTVRVAVEAGGVTVIVAVRTTLPALAVTVTGVEEVTADVVIGNVVLVAPAGTVALVGTLAVPLLLDRETVKPPVGAADVRLTVPVALFPPVTLDGLTDTAVSEAGPAGGDCGVNRRTVEKGPETPAELMPRTRQKCWRTARTGAVNWETVTVWLTTRGLEKVLESSIWMR
jgi:hypothetical protein